MRHLGAGLVGGIVGCLGTVLVLGARGDSVPPIDNAATNVPAPVSGMSPTAADELTRRVAQLEREVQFADRTPVRTPAPLPVDPPHPRADLDDRLRALEAEVAELREAAAWMAIEPSTQLSREESARRMHDLVARLRSKSGSAKITAALVRIPLFLQFLESWPDHEDARSTLALLLADLHRTQQPRRAEAAVERFGPQLRISATALTDLRLLAYSRPADRVALLDRRVALTTDPVARCRFTLKLAQDLRRAGDVERALTVARGVQQEFGGRTDCDRSVTRAARLEQEILAAR